MDFYGRRSIRKYKNIPIEKEKIDELLKVALIAPTGHNARACEFIVFDNEKDVKSLVGIKSSGAEFLETAQACIGIICDGEKAMTWVEDASIAAYTIQLKAHELGLGSCWCHLKERQSVDGKSSEEVFRKLTNTPEKYQVLCLIALGYPNEEKPSYKEENIDFKKVSYGKYGNRR